MFKRVYCIPLPASSMDRVAGVVAVDSMESDTEVASDFCSPEFSTSGAELSNM